MLAASGSHTLARACVGDAIVAATARQERMGFGVRLVRIQFVRSPACAHLFGRVLPAVADASSYPALSSTHARHPGRPTSKRRHLDPRHLLHARMHVRDGLDKRALTTDNRGDKPLTTRADKARAAAASMRSAVNDGGEEGGERGTGAVTGGAHRAKQILIHEQLEPCARRPHLNPQSLPALEQLHFYIARPHVGAHWKTDHYLPFQVGPSNANSHQSEN